MNININEDVDALSQEIANGPPLFPAPNTIPRVITARFRRKCSRGERRITGYVLFFILHITLDSLFGGIDHFFCETLQVIRTLFSRTEHRLFETCTILELLVTGL
ncbi:unnamed protein product [Rhizophagus irregularis]|nr:unnamed protein product [Rhizophagus irregularis]